MEGQKNLSSHVAVATLRKSLITVDQTIAREKLSEWWSEESYFCPQSTLDALILQDAEDTAIHLQTPKFIQSVFRIVFAPVLKSL